jgi:hypothetical protein
MQTLCGLGVEPPFAGLASFINAKGMKLLEGFSPEGALWENMPSTAFARDQFHFVETVF